MADAAEPLVGRPAELDAFNQILVDVDQGRPASLALVGEPGIGKTRLLAELTWLADDRGHLVLAGSASELERDLPFFVFVDALDDYVRGLPEGRLDGLSDDARAELAHVLPSFATTAGTPALQHERYRTHRAVRELLEQLGSAAPVVLVLDDLHWADSGSIELLAGLLRRPPAAPVLIALAVRPRQLPERLSAALERAHAAATLTRMQVDALTFGEARELLGSDVSEAEASALYEGSGGNPFYLEQLARSRGRALGGLWSPSVGGADGAGVPSSVAAALTEELALLPDAVRRVAEGAAVAGDPFDPELAASAAGVGAEVALEALDELLRCDLVRPTDVPRRFRFRHPLVRAAVYDSTPAAWRLGAHERTGEALAVRGAGVATRAHHVDQSARSGDAAAVALLVEAGETAARRAPESAARWFAAALRLLPDSAPVAGRVELILARAKALAATGHFAESHEALLGSVALVPDEAAHLRLRVTTACASVEYLLGRHAAARTRLLSALRGLDEESREAAALMTQLAIDGLFSADYESMRTWAERARDAAQPVGDRALTAAAVAILALAEAFAGRVPEAERACSEATALVDSLSDDEMALRLDAAANLAAAELYLDRYAEAAGHAERALRVGRATGQSDILPVLFPTLGSITRMCGRLRESAELLDGAVEAARLSRDAQGLAWNLLNRSHTALQIGDVELAVSTAEESVELARSLDHGLVSAYAGVALGGALLAAGDPQQAVDVLLGAAGGEALSLIPGGWRAKCLELLTRCWLALDRIDDAARSAERAETRAADVPLNMATAMALRARAAVLLAAGEPAAAAEHALESAARADAVGAPVEAALSRTVAGSALARAGDDDRAVVELRRAAHELGERGANRDRDAAELVLRRLGQQVHRRSRPGKAGDSGFVSLTARELEVARLVVDRKTNPEIGATLFLSTKTIETHIRNMFRKLGVSSRVELARVVELADRAS
jgi:ATP/maltotriose-dependent transcriptional regulator MalT